MLLARKDLKKFGQFELVKLLPRLVSKGRGSGALVDDGAVITVVVEEPELVGGAVTVEGKGVAVVETSRKDEDDAETVALVVGVSKGSPPWRRWTATCSNGRRSTRISPLRDSRANSGPRRNWAGISVAPAAVHNVESNRMVERITSRMVRGSVV